MRRNLSITRKDNLNISWSKSWKIDFFQIRVYKIVPIFHEEHISFQGLILNRCAANIFLSTSFVFFIKENIYPHVSFQRITKSNWYCYVSWNIVNFFSSFFIDRKNKYFIFKIFPNEKIRFHRSRHYLCDIKFTSAKGWSRRHFRNTS